MKNRKMMTLEQMYAYKDARNEMIYGASRRAAEALWEKLSGKLFTENMEAQLYKSSYTYISATLTCEEILRIAADPDVSRIKGFKLPGQGSLTE